MSRGRSCNAILKLGVVLLLLPLASPAQNSATARQMLQATIVPLSGLITQTSSVALTRSGAFGAFSGTMTLSYWARTTQGAGQGAITTQATTDFTPTGGPSIATPPSPGDTFTYTCSGATLGASCSGTQTVSTA